MKDKFYYKFTPQAKAEKIKKKQQYKNDVDLDFDDYDDDDYEEIEEIDTKSEQINKCPHYKKCSGCQLQNLDYHSQIKLKQKLISQKFPKLMRINPILTMENPTHYRNKASCAFSTDRNNRPIHGIFQSKTKHVVKVKDCMIQDKLSNKIIDATAKIVYDFKLKPYNSMKEQGFFRHILVRRSFSTNEIMVVLVTQSVTFPSANSFTKVLLKKFPQITTIVHCVNDSNIDMVVGRTQKILHGNGYINDKLLGLTFKVSPQSFYQINPIQTEKLYKKAIEMADINKSDLVLDAYCGTGTIGMLAASKAKTVFGIEINKEAVKDAISAARNNNISNIRFHCGDAGRTMLEMLDEGLKLDVLFMDPPRSGSDAKFLNAISKALPQKIVYISCNPDTLANDLTKLISFGYTVKEFQPVDMFPFSRHVEACVLLSKNI